MTLFKLNRSRVSLPFFSPTVISVVWNEIARLPAFLRHYRAMDVKDFIFVDHGSDDGTLDFLLDQPDATVYHAPPDRGHSFSEKAFWINSIARKHVYGRWCLVVDADELFLFDASDTQSLPQFTEHIHSSGARAVFAFLLDMYPLRIPAHRDCPFRLIVTAHSGAS